MRPIDADALKAYIDAQIGRTFIGCTVGEALKILVDEQPTVEAEPKWIPVTWHYATESELKERPDIASRFDCDMPNDGDEILVTTGYGYVEKDICYIDDSFYLDRYDWNEIKAWMPLPEPYRGD